MTDTRTFEEINAEMNRERTMRRAAARERARAIRERREHADRRRRPRNPRIRLDVD